MSNNGVKLYSFPRPESGRIPSPSPFVLKLETYLRIAKIDYYCDHSTKFSKKGKLPWIQYEGDEVADSTFCIEYLEKKFDRYLNADLSDEDKAISRAFIKMVEENTVWATLGQGRMVENFPWFLGQLRVPKALHFVLKMSLRRKTINNMWAHGIGRHSHQEIQSIAQSDLQACSKLLGTKAYFMGDKPTTIDATMFGFLAQLTYFMPDGHWTTALITNNFTNLRDYCERIKSEFWPDWDHPLKKDEPAK